MYPGACLLRAHPFTATMAKGAAQAQDLDKVTDYHEEAEVDESKFQKAMTDLENQEKQEGASKADRARELATITVKSADVDLLVTEFEITKEQADLYLRENKGNVEDVIRVLIAT